MNRDWVILKNLISDSTIITLLCDNQESKTQFISNILTLRQVQNKVSIYLDIDTNFTVFLEDHKDLSYSEHLYLFRPNGNTIDDIVAEICSISPTWLDTIIFDSISSFYSTQGETETSSNMNRRLGRYISLLQTVVSRNKGHIIFTSMTRARKKRDETWYISYAGGRLLTERSDLILELKNNKFGFEVSILKSPDSSLIGSKLNLNEKYIKN
ncbi:hypothetical protein ACFL96_18935 [Thermoproteota archaeon]